MKLKKKHQKTTAILTPKEQTEVRFSLMVRIFKATLIISAGVVGFILWTQFGPESGKYRAAANKMVYTWDTIWPLRGNILAEDGRVLATSVPMYDFRMDFASDGFVDSLFKKNVKGLADSLSQMFGDRSAAQYESFLRDCRSNPQKKRYVMIPPRKVNYPEMSRMMNFPFWKLGRRRTGLIVVQSTQRIRPHGSMALRTIGNVNNYGKGSGLEMSFNEELSGKYGLSKMRKVSGSFKVPEPDERNIEPDNGVDVVTTIDIDIQDVADASLRRQIMEQQADWGTAVLMEVATGKILAMANITRKGDQLVEDYNHALRQRLEPGSTIKLASLLVLLEDAKMTLSDTLDTGKSGTAIVNGFKETDTHGYGVQSLRGIFELSSNIGFAKAVTNNYAKDPQRFIDQLRKLGIDTDLEMQIDGALNTTLYDTKHQKWTPIALNKVAFGYFVYITPMQVLALYNTVANNGKMMAPMIVSELRSYGNTVESYKPRVLIDRICSQATLDSAKICLEGVVNDGTAQLLKNDYYDVAGKTGTAQLYDDVRGTYKYADGSCNYLATLVGYFPADNPKYSCIVSIKTFHKSGSKYRFYGGSLSGPVFKDIADRVMSKEYEWQRELSEGSEAAKDHPKIKSGSASQKDIRRIAKSEQFRVERYDGTEGEYNRFEWQGDTLAVESIKVDSIRMPNVKGMGLRDAVSLLEGMGLKVSHSGKGSVVSQSPAAGSRIKRGNSASLTLQLK